MPSSLYSDQGANLTSNLISSLCQNLGIVQTQTSAYHLQGNAQVERSYIATLFNLHAYMAALMGIPYIYSKP